MTEKEKMLSGELCLHSDEQLHGEQLRAALLNEQYNAASCTE
jgi:hypothetical protein